jgi:hypothetical protein
MHSLTLALDGVSGQLHAPAALPPGKEPLALDRRLGGAQNWSECSVEEKNSQPLPGLKPQSSSL